MQKRVLTIQDISCVGQCSLTVALPIISACGVETCVLPSAVLSAISFIPTPGNSGGAEFSFAMVFASVGTGFVFPAMMTWRIISFYAFIIIGFLFLNTKKRAEKKKARQLQFTDITKQ